MRTVGLIARHRLTGLKTVLLVSVIAACGAATGAPLTPKAPRPNATPILPAAKYTGSTGRLTASGSTTLHDWSLKSTHLNGTVSFGVAAKSGGPAARLTALSLKIPVLSLKSSDTGMEHTAYRRLRRRQHPFITYRLVHARLTQSSTGRNAVYVFAVAGKLTVAGKKRLLALRLTVVPGPGKKLSISTSVKLKMTHFGINPPTAFLGLIRSANTVTIRAVWNLSRRNAPVHGLHK